MSAFLVDHDTINAVCTALEAGRLTACEDSDRLGVDLLHLNYRALGERYHECEVPDKASLSFRYSPKGYTLVQLLKAVRCLRYQCAEGSVPDELLFKRLEACIGALALQIVDALPEYQECDGWH